MTCVKSGIITERTLWGRREGMGFRTARGAGGGPCTVDAASVGGSRVSGRRAGELMFSGGRCGSSYFLGNPEAKLLAKNEE